MDQNDGQIGLNDGHIDQNDGQLGPNDGQIDWLSDYKAAFMSGLMLKGDQTENIMKKLGGLQKVDKIYLL